jgi:hypothetical protein
MAIDRFVNSTLNTATNANPRASNVAAGSTGLNATLAWDSAVVLTNDQLRACVAAMLQTAQGQLTGP